MMKMMKMTDSLSLSFSYTLCIWRVFFLFFFLISMVLFFARINLLVCPPPPLPIPILANFLLVEIKNIIWWWCEQLNTFFHIEYIPYHICVYMHVCKVWWTSTPRLHRVSVGMGSVRIIQLSFLFLYREGHCICCGP
jgi:hypothetical protein